jgi:DNA polymerase III epsilon subunit family exonuclease
MSRFKLEQPWRSARFAAVDTETTGTDTLHDRIIEIGIVVFEAGEVVERYQALFHPERELPGVITEVTGIKPEDLVGKPTFAELADGIAQRLSAQPLLAYNAEFDLGILRSEFDRVGVAIDLPPCIDPFPFCWENLRERGHTRSAQLSAVARFLGVSLESAHRADHDAEAAARVMLALPGHAELPEQLGALLQLQAVVAQRVNDHFARFRRGKGAQDNRGTLQAGVSAIELGPAYVYGEETDPVRALFARIPDVRDRAAASRGANLEPNPG